MKTIHQLTATAIFCLLLIFTACKKEQSTSPLTTQEEEQAAIASSESEAESEFIMNDIFDNVLGVNAEVGIGGTGIFGRTITNGRVDSLAACASVTFTPASATATFPLKVVIDFGTGCVGRDGRTRSGKLSIVYSGRLIIPGNSATTSFEGYKVNNVLIEGTHKITNTSTSATLQFNVNVNGKMSKTDGNYIQWSSNRQIAQIEGSVTPFYPFDDLFAITGSSGGTVKRNTLVITWESNITQPLQKRFTCRWITAGKINTTRKNAATNGVWTGELNFGTGNCDNQAILNINGKTIQITLY
jgi:hypothetical protein